MVNVFKTDVQSADMSDTIIHDLLQIFPSLRINFDLEDEDCILRVEGAILQTDAIINCLNEKGHCCVYLPIDVDK